jgi:hypothetical protein
MFSFSRFCFIYHWRCKQPKVLSHLRCMQSLWHHVLFHSKIDGYICALKEFCEETYQVSTYQWFFRLIVSDNSMLESSWKVMAHGDAREGKWRGNWRMEWVASTLHTTSEHSVSNITTADVYNLPASSRQNWSPPLF